MELNINEAKIIIYLSRANNEKKNVWKIKDIIKKEYNYTCRILLEMKDKRLLRRHKGIDRKVYYDLSTKGKFWIEDAAELLLQAKRK